jgi:hypothetical protein
VRKSRTAKLPTQRRFFTASLSLKSLHRTQHTVWNQGMRIVCKSSGDIRYHPSSTPLGKSRAHLVAYLVPYRYTPAAQYTPSRLLYSWSRCQHARALSWRSQWRFVRRRGRWKDAIQHSTLGGTHNAPRTLTPQLPQLLRNRRQPGARFLSHLGAPLGATGGRRFIGTLFGARAGA